MDNYKNEFIKIRSILTTRVQEAADTYLVNLWDPIISYNLNKEIKKLLNRNLSKEFPNFPVPLLPTVKINVSEDEDEFIVEILVQKYLNKNPSLIFLGNAEYNNIFYDLYCKKSWDPNFPYILYERHGHEDEMFSYASKTAQVEYLMGFITPLSIAFQLALDEGYFHLEED